MTLAAADQPLADFASWISVKTGISIVVADNLDERRITLSVVDLPIDDLMTAVARRVGAQVNRMGNLYVIGDLRPEDRALFVTKVGRVLPEDLVALCNTLISDNGRMHVAPDGLLVIADRVEVIAQVASMIAKISASPPDTWCMMFYVVDVYDEYFLDLGGNPIPTAQLTASVADGSAIASLSSWSAAAALELQLKAAQGNGSLDLRTRQMLLAVPGRQTTWVNERNQPYVTRSVTESGVVVDSGVDYLTVGDRLQVKLSQLENGLAVLDYTWRSSRVLEETDEGLPVDRTLEQASQVAVNSGGVYMLASLELSEDSQRTEGIVPLHLEKQNRARRVEIWATVYRIDHSKIKPNTAPADAVGVEDVRGLD